MMQETSPIYATNNMKNNYDERSEESSTHRSFDRHLMNNVFMKSQATNPSSPAKESRN